MEPGQDTDRAAVFKFEKQHWEWVQCHDTALVAFVEQSLVEVRGRRRGVAASLQLGLFSGSLVRPPCSAHLDDCVCPECYEVLFRAGGVGLRDLSSKLAARSLRRTFGKSVSLPPRRELNAGYVVRMMAPLSFQSCSWHQWNALMQQPGTFARQWATRVLPGCSSQQLSPRVFKLDVALQLVKLSDSLEFSERAFRCVSPEMVQPHSVAWMPWNDDESWSDYIIVSVSKIREVLSRGSNQLGLRVQQGPLYGS